MAEKAKADMEFRLERLEKKREEIYQEKGERKPKKRRPRRRPTPEGVHYVDLTSSPETAGQKEMKQELKEEDPGTRKVPVPARGRPKGVSHGTGPKKKSQRRSAPRLRGSA